MEKGRRRRHREENIMCTTHYGTTFYSVFHKVSYLDTAPVGLPSGTAHTQCTVYLQSLDDSGTDP